MATHVFFPCGSEKSTQQPTKNKGFLQKAIWMYATDEYMQHTHACMHVCVCVSDMRFRVGPQLAQNVNLCTLLGFHGFFM